MPSSPARPYRLVLLGPPGIGKGTQAELLSARLNACHLSTGDIFRAAKCMNGEAPSPALEQALQVMRRGELVSDETVLAMIRERARCLRCGGGFLLDGFPRTLPQAEALTRLMDSDGLHLDAVVGYELPIEKIITRLAGRRTCAGCKAVFHIAHHPPRSEGGCDHCGGKLFQREDDRPESISIRMAAYERSTKPLLEYYRKQRLLVTISADGSPEEILQRTVAAIENQPQVQCA